MSELMESRPSFTHLDAGHSALEHHVLLPTIAFDEIAVALSYIDPRLAEYDYDHHMQEQRITEIYLTVLDSAKNLYDNGEYSACQVQFNTIIALVRPTNNEVLLASLQYAHDQLYR